MLYHRPQHVWMLFDALVTHAVMQWTLDRCGIDLAVDVAVVTSCRAKAVKTTKATQNASVHIKQMKVHIVIRTLHQTIL